MMTNYSSKPILPILHRQYKPIFIFNKLTIHKRLWMTQMTQLDSLYVGSLEKAIKLSRRRLTSVEDLGLVVKRVKLRTGRCTEFETDVHVFLRPHGGLNETRAVKAKIVQMKVSLEDIANTACGLLSFADAFVDVMLLCFWQLTLPWMNSWHE